MVGRADICECDCHAVAAAGRETVLAKLAEGVDFSPLFSDTENRFRSDMDSSDMDLEPARVLAGLRRR